MIRRRRAGPAARAAAGAAAAAGVGGGLQHVHGSRCMGGAQRAPSSSRRPPPSSLCSPAARVASAVSPAAAALQQRPASPLAHSPTAAGDAAFRAGLVRSCPLRPSARLCRPKQRPWAAIRGILGVGCTACRARHFVFNLPWYSRCVESKLCRE